MASLPLEMHVEKVKNGYLAMIFNVKEPTNGNEGGTAVTGADAEEFVENLAKAVFAELVRK